MRKSYRCMYSSIRLLLNKVLRLLNARLGLWGTQSPFGAQYSRGIRGYDLRKGSVLGTQHPVISFAYIN